MTTAPRYEQVRQQLQAAPKTWLVTGVAGFIGSNLLETLLKLDQRVIGLDNFATGFQHNLDEVQGLVSPEQWARFEFIEGDIRHLPDCQRACANVDYVLHQAALGSVPRSLADPITTNSANITGFLNMLVAARDAQVKSFTYAASSSTYGDHPALPKVENRIGNPLSPYAVTKFVNELYAGVFSKNYSFHSIGLRYFNVFGKRQNPNGAYAAVIPKWAQALISNQSVFINGNGTTSRDFCYIENAVQANLLAATTSNKQATNQIYNIAAGTQTSLNNLFEMIKEAIRSQGIASKIEQPEYLEFREGDILHSLADISKAHSLLGYIPTHSIKTGMTPTIEWYASKQ